MRIREMTITITILMTTSSKTKRTTIKKMINLTKNVAARIVTSPILLIIKKNHDYFHD